MTIYMCMCVFTQLHMSLMPSLPTSHTLKCPLLPLTTSHQSYHPPHSPLSPLSSLNSPVGTDFAEVNQSITISSPFTLSVMIFEDSIVETNETFFLSLTSDDMGVNIMTDTAVITITDASECAVYSTLMLVYVWSVYDTVAGDGIPG